MELHVAASPDPALLIEKRRKAKIRSMDFAAALGIERTTLWKRENQPTSAPAGWWSEYESTLQQMLVKRASEALALAGQP